MSTAKSCCGDESQQARTITRFTLAELTRARQTKADVFDKPARVYGWIRRVRIGESGKLPFIDVYDGTTCGALMGIAHIDYYQGSKYGLAEEPTPDEREFKVLDFEHLSQADSLSPGCAVVLDGIPVLAPEAATQDLEFQIHRLRVIGGVQDPRTYPIQKSSEKKLISLRQLPFMRFRAQVCQSLFRIASKLQFACEVFMDEHDVIKTDPAIITGSDCEGAGEVFSITPLLFDTDEKGDSMPAGLAVSSQLPLEATITGFTKTWTMQKSFRAEKSDTSKHLAEFLHVEYEEAFTTLDDLMTFTEKFVKFLMDYVCKHCKTDLDFLHSKLAPDDVRPSRQILLDCIVQPFIRIKHCDAVALIQKLVKDKVSLPDSAGKIKRVKVDEFPSQGSDLASEHEAILVQYFGFMALPEETRTEWIAKGKSEREVGAFVFVTHWPLAIKSFYMKQCDDGSGECESFDLLAPRVGEMFGGSMREWRHDKLSAEITRRKMDLRPLQWFLDLRKSGSAPHGGWGMGFARLCMLVTGVPSVRDVVPFPVYYGSKLV
jgi:asparaginyl-tRNA synthetase